MDVLRTLLLSFFVLTTGCESGQEAAVVKSASAIRESDDRITVHAELDCQLLWGMPRASGCDADDSDVCFHAKWIDANSIARDDVRWCNHVNGVRDATTTFTTPNPMPKRADLRILVETELALESRDSAPDRIVIDNP